VDCHLSTINDGVAGRFENVININVKMLTSIENTIRTVDSNTFHYKRENSRALLMYFPTLKLDQTIQSKQQTIKHLKERKKEKKTQANAPLSECSCNILESPVR